MTNTKRRRELTRRLHDVERQIAIELQTIRAHVIASTFAPSELRLITDFRALHPAGRRVLETVVADMRTAAPPNPD